MYGMHVASLIIGLMLYNGLTTAVKPGYLDFDNLPDTNFSCTDKVIGGYYADVETGCQMFHVCTIGQKAEVTDIKFLCLNGTVFDQETRVCERIDEVDCSKSEQFFNLNLELYGNQAGGIAPEDEFLCEVCDEENEEDYDGEDVTTSPTATTVNNLTSLVGKSTSTTSSTTTSTSEPHYPTSSPETIAALLALHKAFPHSVHPADKVIAAPPRVINEALSNSNVLSAPKSPYFGRPTRTQLPPPPPSNDDQPLSLTTAGPDFYTPHPPQQHYTIQSPPTEPFYRQTTTSPANYHHFQGKNSGFVHSFDPGKQYNFEYFHPKKLREAKPKASVLIVTSTSTSTSSRGPKLNATLSELAKEDDFPVTGFDDYSDEVVEEEFFRNVPKVRSKREQQRHLNHRYPDEGSTSQRSPKQFPNHRYGGEESGGDFSLPGDVPSQSEAFLQNLLGSLDMDEHDRQKMVNFFKVEKEVDSSTSGALAQLETSLEELVMEDVGKTIQRMKTEERNTSEGIDQLNDVWTRHFLEMSQEVDLNFESGTERDRRDADRKDKLTKELEEDYALVADYGATAAREKRQLQDHTTRLTARRRATTTRRVPVFEEVDEGDLTTRPYVKAAVSSDQRTESGGTRRVFDYELTATEPAPKRAALPEEESQPPPRRRARPTTTTSPRAPAASEPPQSKPQSSLATTRRYRGNVRGSLRSTTSIWEPPPAPTMSPDVVADPNFDCEGKIKGGFYADTHNDCRGFFICSQGAINGPLLKSHFWCGTSTKFNQRSRTCQAEDLVECAVSHRYFHLNEDFAVPGET